VLGGRAGYEGDELGFLVGGQPAKHDRIGGETGSAQAQLLRFGHRRQARPCHHRGEFLGAGSRGAGRETLSEAPLVILKLLDPRLHLGRSGADD